jgi:choline dehydrogenase-like flavoprotein
VKLPAGVLEGQTVDRDLDVDADVCIVGSGPGGAVTAATLAARGLSVVVLEEGGYFTKERYRLRDDDAFPLLYQDGAQRTTKDLAITILQGKAVGGGTAVNWTTCFRTPDDVVAYWRDRHEVGGVSSAELAPFFAAAEQRLSIAEVPEAGVNRNNATLRAGCEKLGIPTTLLRRNVKNCAMTGGCGLGCPVDAKQSATITYLPDAMRAGAAIVSRCRVRKLVLDGDRATAVEGAFLDAAGVELTGPKIVVKPRVVVVAGGAINSPALLLRSGAPDPHGVLGRRTFLHPTIASAATYAEPVDGWYGPPQSIASHHFAHRGDEIGFFLEAGPLYPLLTATSLPGFGKPATTSLRTARFNAAHLAITVDGFHDDVVGGRVGLLASGAPFLDYPIVDRQWRGLREAYKVLARIGLASGATLVRTLHDPPLEMRTEADLAKIDDAPFQNCRFTIFSAHQMGGCGMSDDPKRGVVRSSDLRHHQLQNVHVVDGSAFPTSLGVNPQLSIFGLAGLVSSRLAQALARS